LCNVVAIFELRSVQIHHWIALETPLLLTYYMVLNSKIALTVCKN
jgi:hypothetical protein